MKVEILYPLEERGIQMDEQNARLYFSRNLRYICTKNLITQQVFADKCGNLSVYTLQNYLYGKSLPPISIILKICNSFSTTPNRLFEGSLDFVSEQTKMDKIASFLSNLDDKDIKGIVYPLVNVIMSDNKFMKKARFGARLKYFIEESKLSDKDICAKCGIKIGTLKLHESEQRYPKTTIFLKYCSELKISPDYFLCNEVNSPLKYARNLYMLTPRQLTALVEMSEHISS